MSFQTLLDIARENREHAESRAGKPPVSCPIDGSRLDVRDDVHNCPMGNYRWSNGQGVVLADTGGR